jgi:opacity protein-like surface antigen
VGSVGEYAVYAVLPQVRWRLPLLGDRLVPYVVGGAGIASAEFNDRKPRGGSISIKAHTESVAAAAGAGIEYLVTNRVAVGMESKYFYSPQHAITVNGHSEDARLKSVLVSAGLRVYLFDFVH